jgi:hypothetical protein
MAFLVLASSPATGAGAQASPDSSAVEPSIVVDGADWMGASSSERRAFLMGVGNMIAAELAYAKHRQLGPPAASDRIAAAVQDLKLGDIENVITAWYEANAAKRSFPVMGVIWQHIVKRQP